MEISDKKTVLDDSAAIYQRREEKSDRAKWKEVKGFKAKWEHFRAYYLLKTVIWIGVIALAVYGIYEIVAPEKENVIYVAVLDAVVSGEATETLQKGFEEYVELDPETQRTIFDNTMLISMQGDAASAQKFATHAFAGEIDVMIATESVFKGYVGTYLRPLSEQLPADLYTEISERFCYAAPTDEDGNVGASEPYGIFVTDLLEKSPLAEEPLVLAICGNSKNEKNAEDFVRYLLERGGSGEEETQ